MKSKVVPLAALVCLFSIGAALAADEAASDDNAASLPQEPDVTITQHGQERVEEFRINNQIYMIKVTPAKGYPYYLVDTTGDGNFDTRRPQLTSAPVIPQWVLLRWK